MEPELHQLLTNAAAAPDIAQLGRLHDTAATLFGRSADGASRNLQAAKLSQATLRNLLKPACQAVSNSLALLATNPPSTASAATAWTPAAACSITCLNGVLGIISRILGECEQEERTQLCTEMAEVAMSTGANMLWLPLGAAVASAMLLTGTVVRWQGPVQAFND
jgi:hypothetical protein